MKTEIQEQLNKFYQAFAGISLSPPPLLNNSVSSCSFVVFCSLIVRISCKRNRGIISNHFNTAEFEIRLQVQQIQAHQDNEPTCYQECCRLR